MPYYVACKTARGGFILDEYPSSGFAETGYKETKSMVVPGTEVLPPRFFNSRGEAEIVLRRNLGVAESN